MNKSICRTANNPKFNSQHLSKITSGHFKIIEVKAKLENLEINEAKDLITLENFH